MTFLRFMLVPHDQGNTETRKIFRYLFLKHWHLSLTSITCLFLTTWAVDCFPGWSRNPCQSIRHLAGTPWGKSENRAHRRLQIPPRHYKEAQQISRTVYAKPRERFPVLASEWVIKVFLPPPPPLSWVSTYHCHLIIFLRYITDAKMG